MNKDEFDSLQIGTRVKVMRGLSTPPIRGILADKVNESALIRTGHTPSGKPILRWEHYMSLKVEDKKCGKTEQDGANYRPLSTKYPEGFQV